MRIYSIKYTSIKSRFVIYILNQSNSLMRRNILIAGLICLSFYGHSQIKKKSYLLTLNEDRIIKTKLIGSLKHSAMYYGKDKDSSYTVLVPFVPGNGKLDWDNRIIEIAPLKKPSNPNKVIVRRINSEGQVVNTKENNQ